jgi:hypothetical protein
MATTVTEWETKMKKELVRVSEVVKSWEAFIETCKVSFGGKKGKLFCVATPILTRQNSGYYRSESARGPKDNPHSKSWNYTIPKGELLLYTGVQRAELGECATWIVGDRLVREWINPKYVKEVKSEEEVREILSNET